MDRKRFQAIAEAVFEDLPSILLELGDNVAFWVEDWPDRETLEELGMDHRDDLLGLYRGLPLTDRSVDLYGTVPDHVVLYQFPIERNARELGQDVAQVVRETLIHELGHHLGFNEAQLLELERQD